MGVFFFFLFSAGVIAFAYIYERDKARLRACMTPEEKAHEQHGLRNPAMLCPHCQLRGEIRTKVVTRKKGVSGGKATAALLTVGTSLLVTGLSRKEALTEAWCGNCKNTWAF